MTPLDLDHCSGDRPEMDCVPALAVATSQHRARAVATRGHQEPSAESPYRIASLTKPLTATAIVLALRDRSIPLSTPAVELLPVLASDWVADRALTVAQLLGQVSDLCKSVDASMMAAPGSGDEAMLEGAWLVVRAGSERQPGERWSYYNGNYFLLGAVLAAVAATSYEEALANTVLRPWNLTRTGFDTPPGAITGWDGPSLLPVMPYPRARRPSGGLWSCVTDVLSFAEHILDDASLLAETRRPQTRPADPMAYGLGWALGPSGQMYLNGRLPGYRSALLVLPDHGYSCLALANQQQALPALARLLSDLQHPATGDDLTSVIVNFAA